MRRKASQAAPPPPIRQTWGEAVTRARWFLLAFLLAMALPAPIAGADFGEFELESAGASLSTYQAGAHADFTTEFVIKQDLAGGDVAQTRDVIVELPPGLLGNPIGTPRCTMAELSTKSCPQDSQVGITDFRLREAPHSVLGPIYNMTTAGADQVARFGFFASLFPVTINARVRSESDYGVTVSLDGLSSLAALREARTTIWGVPGSQAHDAERITPQEGEGEVPPPPGGRPSGIPPAPFLSNPTRCGGPLHVSIAADSYQRPGAFSTKDIAMAPISGCSKLSFTPSFSAKPTNRRAAAPTGLDVTVEIPQDEHPLGLATSQVRDAVATLPEGMTLSPAAAAGLVACDASQAGYKAVGPAHCPDASKIGSVELDVPGLEHRLVGSIYQRAPEPGHLFRIWIVADELGVHVALPGEIEVDKQTGQVTSVFLETPEVPLREAQLHVFGGSRAPLAAPSRCGTYSTRWLLAPWSGRAPASGEAPMTIDEGCDTGGFQPELSAGTTNPLAGAFAPFVLELRRSAGDQNIVGLEIQLPPGLLAKLRGIPLCEGAAAAAGDCPVSSRIGSVATLVGPGEDPLLIPQPDKQPTAIFLGGPYKGGPYSMVIRVPAEAGPFDLGAVAVRAAIEVDPRTAQVTVHSDPLPQILEGVPISYRLIHAQVDRSHFTLNPTNCAPKEVLARVTGSAGATLTRTAGYQASACNRLRFSPRLSLRLKGGMRRTQHPALTAVLTQGRGQANNARATVVFPPSEFIDQSHISNPCTRPQFNARECPGGSVLGTAEAVTPLLDRPLKGKVYFRSNGGARELPDVVADLRGPIHITLVGFIDSVQRKGSEVSRLRTTFANIPDAPVSKFTIRLFGGKRGLLVNSRNLCSAPRPAEIDLRAQNGKAKHFSEPLSRPCIDRKGKR
jgi:hypothetical protein